MKKTTLLKITCLLYIFHGTLNMILMAVGVFATLLALGEGKTTIAVLLGIETFLFLVEGLMELIAAYAGMNPSPRKCRRLSVAIFIVSLLNLGVSIPLNDFTWVLFCGIFISPLCYYAAWEPKRTAPLEDSSQQ
jgi:hypothetical protein